MEIEVQSFLPKTQIIEEIRPKEDEKQLLNLTEKDLYQKKKELERKLEFLTIQEEFIKNEQQNLKRELIRSREEIKRIQSVPLVIGPTLLINLFIFINFLLFPNNWMAQLFFKSLLNKSNYFSSSFNKNIFNFK